ncbi:glyoxylase I 4 [Castanea sativa]|uniref:glyoxylase I 4 n=1 Tax=Castanea sativa TaxID=21020 RepID=UPI003F64D209
MALNHVSRLCRNLKESRFLCQGCGLLGFVLIERPHAFDFDGAWLFNYGVGVHLLQAKDEDRLPNDPDHLDPNDNHISFQCENMEEMEQKLKDFNIKYKKRTVEDVENRTKIDKLFFNDPDGFMIEICNCENLKLVPAGSLGKIKLPVDRHNPPVELENGDDTK